MDLARIREAVPEPIATLMRELDADGARAYLVGGSLRDLVAGRTPADWDLAVDLDAAALFARFPDATPIGFGCARLVLADGLTVETAPLRSDGPSEDGRHPSGVVPVATIEEDLARRDFTMNALALGPTVESVDLVDPFGGRRDIARRLIRSVGDPARSMRDDALRALRALRFVGELGWSLEEETARAIADAPVERLSAARVGDELLRLLSGPHVDRGLAALAGSGLLDRLAPGLVVDPPLPGRLAALHGLGPRLHELTRGLPEDALAALFGRWSLPRPLRFELASTRALEAAIDAAAPVPEEAARLRLLAHREAGSADTAAELLGRRIALGRAGEADLALLGLLLAPALREAPVSAAELALDPAELPGSGPERGALLDRLLVETAVGRLAEERRAMAGSPTP
jgi:tRNA nucleotidyltransferase (CCA-adding enzyme)